MVKRGLLFIGLLMLLIACSSSGLEVTDDIDTTDLTKTSNPNI